MNNFQTIRSRLNLSQAELAEALGMSQPNVSKYENGQDIPPDTARKLISLAQSRGVSISFDDIYGVAAA
ncbi:helix-turn-helix domain-containing protein [Methylobacillus sp. Pita2]|uniref:helix-turn-helix domain-containing protein n=1 Tax=Methylobacillus sp. Pita2 TaxID=3383245 RepID=UPI0038B6A609